MSVLLGIVIIAEGQGFFPKARKKKSHYNVFSPLFLLSDILLFKAFAGYLNSFRKYTYIPYFSFKTAVKRSATNLCPERSGCKGSGGIHPVESMKKISELCSLLKSSTSCLVSAGNTPLKPIRTVIFENGCRLVIISRKLR